MIKAIFFDTFKVLIGTDDFSGIIFAYEKKHQIAPGKLYQSMHDRQYWLDWSLGRISQEVYYQKVKADFAGQLDTREINQSILDSYQLNQELFTYLKTLKDRYQLGVISNSPKEWFNYCVEKFGWRKLFTVLVSSSQVQCRKPAKAIFQYALDQAGAEAEETVYVDDRPERVGGAKELGLKLVIFNNVEQLKRDINGLII